MNSIKQAIWLSILLFLLAFSGWYFAWSSAYSLSLLNPQASFKTPDTIITNLTYQQFDENGQLKHILKTPCVKHLAENNTHLFQAPFILVKDDQTTWDIHADEGIALDQGEEITLHHQVVIHAPKSETTDEITISTESITYYPQKNIARNQEELTVTQSGNTMQSHGMNAYLSEHRLELLDHARGVYAQNHG